MRKVCVVIGSRANYGSIKSVMRAVRAHPELRLQIVVGASALLDRFGSVVEIIERDGFVPDARVNMIVEGETPVTMAKSTGLGLLELATVFQHLLTATLHLLAAIHKLYPRDFAWLPAPYEYEREKMPIDILFGSPRLRETLLSESAASDVTIRELARLDESAWWRRVQPYLLYA